MTTKRMCRAVSLASILLTAGLASSGCGREEARLTAPRSSQPTPSMSQSSLPATYSWTVTTTDNVAAGFDWNWQLADGTTITGGDTGSSSQTGTVPPTAIAIVVIGNNEAGIGGCGSGKTVTKSLGNNQTVSVTMKLTMPSSVDFFGQKVLCPPGSSTLKFVI